MRVCIAVALFVSSVTFAQEPRLSEELIDALKNDVSKGVISTTRPFRLYHWTKQDRIPKNFNTRKDLATYFEQTWTGQVEYLVNSKQIGGGNAGGGIYAAADPAHSSAYGFSSGVKWVLVSIPIPQNTRFLTPDTDAVIFSAQTRRYLAAEDCDGIRLWDLKSQPQCIAIYHYLMKLLNISGIMYDWDQGGLNGNTNAFVLFNPALFKQSALRVFTPDVDFSAESDDFVKEAVIVQTMLNAWPVESLNRSVWAKKFNEQAPAVLNEQLARLKDQHLLVFHPECMDEMKNTRGKILPKCVPQTLRYSDRTLVPPYVNSFSGMAILAATYGSAAPKNVNFLPAFQKLCKQQALCRFESDDYFGLQGKINVTYLCSGKTKVKTVDKRWDETLSVFLGCDMPLQITAASGKFVTKTGNLSQIFTSKCSGISKCSVQIDADVLAKYRGCQNALNVEYACGKNPLAVKTVSLTAINPETKINLSCE